MGNLLFVPHFIYTRIVPVSYSKAQQLNAIDQISDYDGNQKLYVLDMEESTMKCATWGSYAPPHTLYCMAASSLIIN